MSGVFWEDMPIEYDDFGGDGGHGYEDDFENYHRDGGWRDQIIKATQIDQVAELLDEEQVHESVLNALSVIREMEWTDVDRITQWRTILLADRACRDPDDVESTRILEFDGFGPDTLRLLRVYDDLAGLTHY